MQTMAKFDGCERSVLYVSKVYEAFEDHEVSPNIINKFRNVSILWICRSKMHDCYSWFKIKTNDMNTHIRHENRVYSRNFPFENMFETKTRDLYFH